MSTRARLAILLVAAALIVIGALLATRGRTSAKVATGTTRATPTSTPQLAPVLHQSAPAASAVPTAATELDDPTPVLDATHAAVQTIGRHCWQARTPHEVPPGQPDDTVGRLELHMQIAVAGGEARVVSQEVVSTRRLTEELRDCIVAGVTGATWPVASPDTTMDITELFRMGDYTLPDPDCEPPSAPPR